MKLNASDKKVDITRRSDKYWVPVVAKAIDVLDCFESDLERLTLEQVVQRTHVPHTTAYRILHTLVIKDYLHQAERTYRLNGSRRRFKLGFANLSKQISLAVEIQNSLERAAAAQGLHLFVWDNNRDADTAIRNAQAMVDEKVDVAVEFQLFEHVAPVIADILSRAHIPLISIVNPHHGTLYFGVNNYRAGHCAGRSLAEYAADHWHGPPDSLLLVESPHAGRTVQSRLIGVLRGIEERLGPLGDKHVHHLDGGGERATSCAAVENFFRRHSPRHVLIAGLNDESAMGAADAEQSMRDANVAIVGHGGSPEMMALIADPNSPCIGTVSFRAQLYGPELVRFAQSVVQGGSVTAAKYVPHEFLGKAALTKSYDRPAKSAYITQTAKASGA
jgi:ribose transport system substrate-binding protein